VLEETPNIERWTPNAEGLRRRARSSTSLFGVQCSMFDVPLLTYALFIRIRSQ